MSEYDELEEVHDEETVSPASQPAPAAAPDFTGPIYKRLFEGMPAPFFNPNAAKEYYRFFFGGVLMLIGCLMPFDADWAHLGYRSFAGACCLVIALGVIWSAWISINIPTMVRMKWYALATIPFVWGLLHMIFLPAGLSWGDLGPMFGDLKTGGLREMGDFFQKVGPGKIFVFFGALMVEFTFLGGIFGGAKQLKTEKGQSRRR